MLKNVPLFASLSEEELDALWAAASTRMFPKSTVVLQEGDAAHALYIITSGKVKVILNDADGKEVIIAVLGPGEHFGEMALIDDQMRSATVVTVEPSQFAIISRDPFQSLLHQYPRIALNLLKVLSQRLRAANRKIESLALMDVYGRVARLLLDSAEPDNGKLVVQKEWTHREIASMIGASREMVTRIFKALTVGGYITVSDKRITLNRKLPLAW